MLYNYVTNNPTNRIDPLGLQAVSPSFLPPGVPGPFDGLAKEIAKKLLNISDFEEVARDEYCRQHPDECDEGPVEPPKIDPCEYSPWLPWCDQKEEDDKSGDCEQKPRPASPRIPKDTNEGDYWTPNEKQNNPYYP